jgi:light-harvesting complex 1 beta chain
MLMTHAESVAPTLGHAHDVRGWFVIFAISFLVFTVIALFGQLLGWHWRSWLPGAEGVKSVFGGVKAAVYSFMSHLT